MWRCQKAACKRMQSIAAAPCSGPCPHLHSFTEQSQDAVTRHSSDSSCKHATVSSCAAQLPSSRPNATEYAYTCSASAAGFSSHPRQPTAGGCVDCPQKLYKEMLDANSQLRCPVREHASGFLNLRAHLVVATRSQDDGLRAGARLRQQRERRQRQIRQLCRPHLRARGGDRFCMCATRGAGLAANPCSTAGCRWPLCAARGISRASQVAQAAPHAIAHVH